jgi:predicted Zn-dependent protease
LLKLERYWEAEFEFADELEDFPQNTRARAGLALVYQRTGRPDEAQRALIEMTKMVPTPDSYALAARLWTGFGDRHEADAVRAESRRLFSRGH